MIKLSSLYNEKRHLSKKVVVLYINISDNVKLNDSKKVVITSVIFDEIPM